MASEVFQRTQRGFEGASRVFKGYLGHSREFNPLEPDYFIADDATSLASNTFFFLLTYITGVIHDPPLRFNRVKRCFRGIQEVLGMLQGISEAVYEVSDEDPNVFKRFYKCVLGDFKVVTRVFK